MNYENGHGNNIEGLLIPTIYSITMAINKKAEWLRQPYIIHAFDVNVCFRMCVCVCVCLNDAHTAY